MRRGCHPGRTRRCAATGNPCPAGSGCPAVERQTSDEVLAAIDTDRRRHEHRRPVRGEPRVAVAAGEDGGGVELGLKRPIDAVDADRRPEVEPRDDARPVGRPGQVPACTGHRGDEVACKVDDGDRARAGIVPAGPVGEMPSVRRDGHTAKGGVARPRTDREDAHGIGAVLVCREDLAVALVEQQGRSVDRRLRGHPRQQEAAQQCHDGTGDDEPGRIHHGPDPPPRGLGGRDGLEDRVVIDREEWSHQDPDLGRQLPLEGVHVMHHEGPRGAA